MNYRHKKSGHSYDILALGLDCTNSRADTKVIIYWRKRWWTRIVRALLAGGLVFVRDGREFSEKFEKMER